MAKMRDLDLEGRVILLATDNSPGAVAGARIAMALATKHRALVHVLNVIDTRTTPFPPAPSPLAIEHAQSHQAQANEVRASLCSLLDTFVDWPVRIALGTPAAEIVRDAQLVDAAVIIVGLRRHGLIDRVLNNETALQVMRHATCPVLGVVPEAVELPAHALAAIDFSTVSLIAARSARAILIPEGVLVLAHVPQLAALLVDEGEKIIHELGVREAFKLAVREIGGDHVAVDHVVLPQQTRGTPADALLDYAEDTRCDLIAAGSAHHGRVDRWMVGSVSTELVRDGRRSVLIVPPRDARR
jgi:nucleotide-binding universal stress UspA family protein